MVYLVFLQIKLKKKNCPNINLFTSSFFFKFLQKTTGTGLYYCKCLFINLVDILTTIIVVKLNIGPDIRYLAKKVTGTVPVLVLQMLPVLYFRLYLNITVVPVPVFCYY
jgi:hypothetical protein